MAAHLLPLPMDIIESEILSRLEVKQLLRLRCVSKTWRNIIDCPYFIKLHLNRTKRPSSDNMYRSLVLSCRRYVYEVSLDSQNLDASKLDHPLMRGWLQILGSCNGLVCISSSRKKKEEIAIWNPSTRKHRLLPCLPFDFDLSCSYSVYGFGYDLIHDDYKLVRTVMFLNGQRDNEPNSGLLKSVEVNVYSLARDSWKSIRDTPYFFRRTNGAYHYASGALHWVATKDNSWNVKYFVGHNIIVALDLALEEYKEVPLPDQLLVNQNSFYMEVGELGGCLCVAANKIWIGFDVWVMKEYGVKDSWNKLFSFPTEENIEIDWSPRRAAYPLLKGYTDPTHGGITIVGFLKGGSQVLLLHYDVNLLSYDLQTKKVKELWIRGFPRDTDPLLRDLNICLMQSLVSLD